MEIDGAIFALIGGKEIMWIATVVLVLFGARKGPELTYGVRMGWRDFRFSWDQLLEEMKASFQSRESDYVAEALTPDNQSAEFLQPKKADEEDNEVKSKLIVWVAQGFGIGRIPFAPGTWGSVLGVVWSVLLVVVFPPAIVALLMLLSSLVAVWFCGRAEQILGQKDPGSIVLDEIIALPFTYAGIWALILQTSAFWEMLPWRKVLLTRAETPRLADIPNAWPVLLAGFLLFRLFDIWKPWPVRLLQNLPGGWGVVVDDLAAALLANVSLILGTVAVLKSR